VWCAVVDDQLIGPFIFEGRLSRKANLRFLQEELPQNEVVLCTSNMTEFLFILHVRLEISLTILSWAMDRTWQPEQCASQVSRLEPTAFLCMGIWITAVVYSVMVGKRDALFGRIWMRRPNQDHSAEAESRKS
jgi:hypothetical protein